jgi:hypothetical protein
LRVLSHLYWTEVSVLLLNQELLILICIIPHPHLETLFLLTLASECDVDLINELLSVVVSMEDVVSCLHLLINIGVLIEDCGDAIEA